MAEKHPDWEEVPYLGTFERMYRDGAIPIDRYVAYIVGHSRGQRYCRTIEASGQVAEHPAAKRNAEKIHARVTELGPSVCKLLIEGGDMPGEKDMPPLD
jgi:hypothetical protein